MCKYFFLVSNILCCCAMQNRIKETISMKLIYKNRKVKSKQLHEIIKPAEYVHISRVKNLMTISEFLDYLNSNKRKILYPLKFGNKAREKVFKKAEYKYGTDILFKTHYNYIWKIATELTEYFKKLKLAENIYKIKKPSCNPSVECMIEALRKNEVIVKKGLDIKLLFIDLDEDPNEQLITIGRNVLFGTTKCPYKDNYNFNKNKLEFELKRLENGEINCTCFAEIIKWFLLTNGFWCESVEYPGHEFVITQLKNDKNEIKIYSINVIEEENIKKIRFKVEDIIECEKDHKIWDGFAKCFPNNKSFLYDVYNITPLGKLIKEAIEYIEFIGYGNRDLETVCSYIKSIKSSIQYLANERKYTNGEDEWNMRILPRQGNKCTLMLNIFDLGEPKIVTEYNKFMNKINKVIKFKSIGNPNQIVGIMKVDFRFPKNWREDYKDCKLIIRKIGLKNKTIYGEFVYKFDKKNKFVTEESLSKFDLESEVLTEESVFEEVEYIKELFTSKIYGEDPKNGKWFGQDKKYRKIWLFQ